MGIFPGQQVREQLRELIVKMDIEEIEIALRRLDVQPHKLTLVSGFQ